MALNAGSFGPELLTETFQLDREHEPSAASGGMPPSSISKTRSPEASMMSVPPAPPIPPVPAEASEPVSALPSEPFAASARPPPLPDPPAPPAPPTAAPAEPLVGPVTAAPEV